MIGSFERKRWAPTRKIALGALVLAAATCTVDAHVGYDLPDDVDGGAPDGGACVPGSTTTCYTGPAGTEGVGLCSAGTATCNGDPDGMTYGSCVGEVLPAAENCATPVDEDCDGLAPSCMGTPLWSKRFGDGMSQFPRIVAADSAGNVVVGGDFYGNLDFGGGALVGMGPGLSSYIVKLDGADGVHLWSKQLGDADVTDLVLAVDALDNVLVMGTLWGNLDFGDGPLQSAGDGDILVAKFDPSGNYLWARSFGDVSQQRGHGIAADDTGSIVLTGAFFGSIDFGGGPLISAGDSDAFIVKFDAAGNWVWDRHFGNTGVQNAKNVAVDGEGNTLVAGSFAGSVDFGGGPLISPLGDSFVVKLDASGNHLWSRRLGGPSAAASHIAVAFDGVGSALLTGYYSATLDFGGESLMSAGGYDLFVTKFDASQNHTFSKRFGDGSDQYGVSVAADILGNLVLTGYFEGAVDFGNGPIASAGSSDILLARLDASGNPLWSRRFGEAATDQNGRSVAVDKLGNTLLAGRFYGAVDFGNGPLLSEGATDIFVAKFSP